LPIKIEVVNRLKEILENNINRLRAGLNKGLWNTEIKISSVSQTVTNKAAALFKSIYSNEDPKGMRIQIREKSFQTGLTSDEISEFFSLPSIELPGIAVNEVYQFGCNQYKHREGVKIGEILFNFNKTGNDVIIPFSSLVRHTLIAGMTGSGKTTTVKTIIKGLNDYKVPFLLIEPVKSEYKDINFVKFIELGKDNFSIDLFRPAVAETPIIQHIDYLRAVFNASFVLYPPMPYVLEKAIYHCYEQKGFKFDNSDFSLTNYPTIFDLIKSIEVVINEVNYSPRLRDDILASLKIRLENLTKGYKGEIFCGSNVLNFESLMKENVIINLDKIVDDEQKSILMSILLVNLFEYNQSLGNTKDLRHITIVEEAHRLLSNESKLGSPDFANPKAKSVEFFANLISEIRSYGEGLIIAEQIPTKLLPDVIKNTATKIIHKLVSYDDKYEMGSSMNFLEGQERVLTLLESGQAIFFSEEMFKPIIIKVNYH
ncbi:MAG: ATP-binding protein, partial [Ignavibacteria bacterium]|nr:ATP-binding protein [Ignavibacteria bacterium]